MPFIHIKSLPFEKPKNITKILGKINRDFAAQTGVPLEHMHSTWEYFQPGHYAKGELAPEFQPAAPHSVLVELLTPDFNKGGMVQKMLQVLAASLAVHAEIPLRKIFILHQQASSGMVFDDGEVVYW